MIYTRVHTQTLYRENTYKDSIPYVVRKSSVVLLPVHNFNNLLFVIFIEHTFKIYLHKHRIVYKNQPVNSNIYVVVKSMVRKFINITRGRKFTHGQLLQIDSRICNVYCNIVNINVKKEMYLCDIFLIMYKNETCVCKGLTFFFICVVVKSFFYKIYKHYPCQACGRKFIHERVQGQLL